MTFFCFERSTDQTMFLHVCRAEALQGKNPGPYSLKAIWYWLTSKKTSAYLTLKTKQSWPYALPMAKFKCVKNEGNGLRDKPAFVAIEGDAGESIPLTAHRLSIFLLALA